MMKWEAEKWDGEFQTLKYHLTCRDLIDKYLDDGADEEYSDDDVMEWISDKVCSSCKYGDDSREDYEDCEEPSLFQCEIVIDSLIGGTK